MAECAPPVVTLTLVAPSTREHGETRVISCSRIVIPRRDIDRRRPHERTIAMREFSPKSASRGIASLADVADIVRDRVVKFNYQLRKFARTSIDQLIGFIR